MTKLIIALLVIGLIGAITPQVYYRYVVSPTIIPQQTTVVESPIVTKVQPIKKVVHKSVVIPVVTPEEKVYIETIFGENAKIATATFMHESGLVLDIKGYNCHYNTKDGKKYSTSCKTIEDRARAWSVDCGIAQINVLGHRCPPELLTLEGNMKAAEKIYKEQGLNAWASYSSGAYKKFLSNS